MIGIIKGSEIKKNKDSDVKRVLLQVEFVEGDVKTIELMTQVGEDVNPGKNARVIVIEDSESYKLGIATSDDIEPTVDAGEKEIYSTDSPITTKKAKIKLDKNEQIILNDGTDYAVAYNDLKTAFDQLKSDFDAHVHAAGTLLDSTAAPCTGSTAAPVASTADMSAAKVEKVRLP